MDHKITVTSPHEKAPDPGRFASDPYYQHLLITQVVRQLLLDPFESSRDLRGAEIRVVMHPDGLHATAELVADDLPEADENLLEHAKRLLNGPFAPIRRVEDVPLPEDQ